MAIDVSICRELGDLLVPLGMYGSKPYSMETLLCAYIDFRRFKRCDPNLSIPDRFHLVYGRDLSAVQAEYGAAYSRFIKYSLEGFMRFVISGFVQDVSSTLAILEKEPLEDYADRLIAAQTHPLLGKARKVSTLGVKQNGNSFGTGKDTVEIQLMESVNYTPLAWKQRKLTKKQTESLAPLFSASEEKQLALAKEYLDIDDALIRKKRRGVRRDLTSLPKDVRIAARELKQMGALEAAKILTVEPDNNDIALETTAFYDAVCGCVDVHDENTYIVIVDPSAYFVSKWLDDEELKDIQVSFVYSNPDMQEYRLVKLWWPFIKPSQYEKREPGKEYQSNISVLTFKQLKSGIPIRKDITCLALNQANKYYNNRNLNGLFSELTARLHHACSIVLFNGCAPTPSDDEIDQVFRGVHTDFTLQQITLFPQGIERATTPRRKMLVFFTHLKNGQFSWLEVPINRRSLVVANGRMYLERSSCPKKVSLSREALKGKSLRLVHSNLRWHGKLVSTRNYVTARQVPFTRELNIGYRYDYSEDGSFLRTTAFFQVRKLTDGSPTGPWRAIPSTTKYKYNVNKAAVHDWALMEYPFAQINKLDVRYLVAEVMGDYSLGENVSLSTIWYINPECESDLSKEESIRLRRLMLSDVGSICLDRSITYASILELIHITFPADSVASRRKYVSVLNSFLEAAFKRGLIMENPIEDLSQPENSILNQDPAFAETRSPLIKRHFTPEERRSALQEILGIEDVALRLACMARLTLGIDGNSLCALHWEDFRAVPVYNFCQFRIYRQLHNFSGYTAFENTGNIRGIPCPPLLAKELMIRKAELKVFFSLTNKELDRYPILVKTNSPDPGDQANFLSPREVSKALKKVISSLGIPDEVFQIPDRVRGTVETNLSYYGSDIFREDFKYRATEYSRMIDGELRTMLGLTLMDTASKHYIDYERDDSQFAMYQKLVRMELLLQSPLPARIFTEIEKHSEDANIQESATPMEKEIAAMEISVAQQRGLELEITITSQHGHNINLIRHQKRRK